VLAHARCPPLLIVSVDGVRVEWDDLHRQLTVQGRRLALRPQAYLFVRTLVAQAKAWEAGQADDRLVGHEALCRETGAPSRHALHALASEVSQELGHCLLVINEYGQGYSMRGIVS